MVQKPRHLAKQMGLIRLALLAILLACSALAQAQEVITAELVRVVDGDTIIVTIHDWPPVVGHEIGVRVDGIDTPELHDQRPEVRALAEQARDEATAFLCQCPTVQLVGIERGKYFRLVADVECNGSDLAAHLVEIGLARSYDGQGPHPW